MTGDAGMASVELSATTSCLTVPPVPAPAHQLSARSLQDLTLHKTSSAGEKPSVTFSVGLTPRMSSPWARWVSPARPSAWVSQPPGSEEENETACGNSHPVAQPKESPWNSSLQVHIVHHFYYPVVHLLATADLKKYFTKNIFVILRFLSNKFGISAFKKPSLI